MAIGRTVIPDGSTFKADLEATDIRGGPGAWMGPALVVARSLVMVALAAFVILVLLPAAVAAQATPSI